MIQEPIPAKKTINQFTYQVSSSEPVQAIVPGIPGTIEKFKFSLLNTYNYKEILKTKGFPIERQVYIYEICQAGIASKILTTYPEFSIFMPCKIAIYENEGKTIISTMNMDLMLTALDGNKEMYTEAAELFTTLKELMHALSNK